MDTLFYWFYTSFKFILILKYNLYRQQGKWQEILTLSMATEICVQVSQLCFGQFQSENLPRNMPLITQRQCSVNSELLQTLSQETPRKTAEKINKTFQLNPHIDHETYS